MNRYLSLVCTAVCAVTLSPTASAADQAPAKPATKPAVASTQTHDKAKGLALAKETVQRISEAQLQVADSADRPGPLRVQPDGERRADQRAARVLPGRAKKLAYTMVPEETTTGAVRLEDKRAGVVWLQIPSKSMLMNTKLGQRVVDACMHPEQKAAVAAAEAAGRATSAGPGSGHRAAARRRVRRPPVTPRGRAGRAFRAAIVWYVQSTHT